jgi:predicted MFS family arabinose efflux permease
MSLFAGGILLVHMGKSTLVRKEGHQVDGTLHSHHPEGAMPRSLLLLLAVTSGAVVANLYYNQPLLAAMAHDLQIPETRIGLIPTLTQIGYGLGLLFITPLGDRAERRRLIVTMVLLAALALGFTAVVHSAHLVIALSLLIGLFSVVPQLIVPFAATLASPLERNRVVGVVMSGLLIGVLLARTASGLIGGRLGWHAVYWSAAALMLAFAALLRLFLPYSRPTEAPRYHQLLGSLPGLLRSLQPVQEAAVTGALIFAAFSVFWTTLVFRLEAPPFHLGAQAAGMFGLVGAAGALAATLSGRMAGRLGPVRLVMAGMGLVLLSWLVLWLGGASLWWLVAGAVLLDFGAQGTHVANQARIFASMPEARSRINTIYMVSFFLGGASGSLAGGFAWAGYGWPGVCFLGMMLMVSGLAVQLLLARRRCSACDAKEKQPPGPLRRRRDKTELRRHCKDFGRQHTAPEKR